jgi:DNA-binding response OmpR family regulator
MDVLVVDDNTQVRELLRRYLHPHDVRVHEAADREHAVARAKAMALDLVFIDWVLHPWSPPTSQDNGVGVCRALRDAGETAPVVMYSSVARSGQALIDALDAGADEFIESPLANLEELAARFRALKRRREWSAAGPTLVVGDISADPGRREVRVRDESIRLSKSELDLLVCLARQRNRTVSRDTLYGTIFAGRHEDSSSNALAVLVQRLRAKLRSAAGQLETVRGLGYRLTDGQ